MSPNLPPNPSSSGIAKQSKRSLFSSCINHLNDLTNINNLRQIQATYDPRQAPETLKLQLLIKSQKSLILDSETSSRDSHAVSKQLYLWSCDQPDRAIQDVGDRLAYMTYQFGDLQSQLSHNLEKSRSDLKLIRNLENELLKLRDREKVLDAQIVKAQQDDRYKKPETTERIHVMMKEHDSIEQRIREITNVLPTERRKLMKSSYQTQFQAYHQLADKLSIISHFGQLLLNELDDDPSNEYKGKDRTANIKGQAADSLARYQGPSAVPTSSQIGLIQPQLGSSELHRADTRMFGETHPHIFNNVAEVGGGAVTQATDQSTIHDACVNEEGLGGRNESEGPTKKASGSSQPPKLPNRPKATTGVQNSSQLDANFPPDQKIPFGNDNEVINESTGSTNVNNLNHSRPHSSIQSSHPQPPSNYAPDLPPPAYSPNQSEDL